MTDPLPYWNPALHHRDLYGLIHEREVRFIEARPVYRLDRVPNDGNAKVGYNSKPPLASRRRFGTESTGR